MVKVISIMRNCEVERKGVIHLKCPVCNSENLKVLDTYTKANGIQRRRECQECYTRFNTYERVVFNSLPKYLQERVLNG
jgi:transcriptional repressor NrdR